MPNVQKQKGEALAGRPGDLWSPVSTEKRGPGRMKGSLGPVAPEFPVNTPGLKEQLLSSPRGLVFFFCCRSTNL